MSTTRRTIVFVFCLMIAYTGQGQQSKIDSLEKRISNLEDYQSNLEKLYQINSATLKQDINAAVEEKVKDIDEAKRVLNWLLWLGIPGTLAGLAIAYWRAVKKARNMITDRIERIVEHKREDFIKLIETQEFDSKLKRIKKLVVLSPNEDANQKIKALFDKFKFQEVRFRVIDQYALIENYDLLVFNDYDGSFEQAIIDQYLANIPDEDVSFVAYTTKNLTRNIRINFSNSPYTLYHNVLSTLKYSEILKVTEA
jgi:hypothetical protein